MFNSIWSRTLTLIGALAIVSLFAGCGGGGSSSSSSTGTGTGTTTTPSPTLVLTGSATSVSSTAPATVSATLRDGTGAPIVGTVVTFAVSGTTIGTLVPASGTALTNASGIASITLTAGTVTGASSVTATATVGTATITSNAFGFTATGTTSAANVTLTASTNAISSSNPATLAATVRDATGAVLPNVVVAFSTAGTGFATFSPTGGTALTDASGVARISLLAGTVFGADTVKASTTISGVTVTSVPLGYTTSGTTSGVARLSLTSSSNTISSSSPATLTATLIDASGAGIPNTVVTFATAGTGYGVFFPTSGTALTNAAGTATVSLNAGTSIGADTLTATATVSGVTVSSTPLGYSVTAAPVTSTAASISFVSATPTVVAIHNTGGRENSAVIFTVRDSNGSPLPNQLVNFTLSTTVGNPTVTASATSGADGTVTAQLQAGTVTTPVRVRATLASNASITTVSSQLVISTALPHQNGFSLSATQLNVEGFSFDGATTTLNVRMSDRYGNLVPDGTAATFRTAGGVSTIQPSCVTVNSVCSVSFSSSGVRPTNGRLVVLATAIGEESFVDSNGNGLYDVGEPYGDLPEAFIDANENGLRDPTEEFVDFNNDGAYSPANGVFNGVLQASGASSTVNVRGSTTIVLSTGGARAIGLPSSIALDPCVNGARFDNIPQSFPFRITDLNGNSMSPGTTIVVTTSNGTLVSLPTSFNVLDNNTTTTPTYPLTIISDATQSSGSCSNTSHIGTLLVTVTSSRGVITIFSIPVTD